MKNEKVKKSLNTIFFMVSITFLFILPLSLVNIVTAEKIAQNNSLGFRKAMLRVAQVSIPQMPDEIIELYNSLFEEIRDDNGNIVYCIIKNNAGEKTGYVLIVSGAGLWGEISALVGYDLNKTTIRGIDFIKQNETPGLGARISEEWFKKQFIGKKYPFTVIPEGNTAKENEIAAVTGATITTNAVLDIIKKSSNDTASKLP